MIPIYADGGRPKTHLTRRGLGALLLGAAAMTALEARAQASPPIRTGSEGLAAGLQSIPLTTGPMPVYVARPDARGRFPVIIVISEVFGLHAYIRDVCRRLAHLGYVAVAPDFFHRAGDPSGLTDNAALQRIASTATNEQVMGDIEATLAWLNDQPFAARRVGITGFSWGAPAVWMAAERFPEIRGGVAWYGRLVKPASGFLADEPRLWPINVAPTLRSPVLGLYAGKDPGIPTADVEAMREVLRISRRRGSDIITYLDAPHGFHADYRPSYNAEASADGWSRMLEHFDRVGLRAPRDWRR